MSFFNVGFNAGVDLVSELLSIKPYRALAGITADAVLEEVHSDDLVMTDHPVEQGATITDHAYKMPANLVLTYGWGSKLSRAYDPGALKSIYAQLLQLQIDRVQFEIYTGKRYYPSMLLQSVSLTTDAKSENGLIVRASCRELITAQTTTTAIGSTANQASPDKTGGTSDLVTVNAVPAENINVTALP